ncbi:hypothetical protein AAHC03_012944 [Spirometra sp. Aus1]
MDFVEQSEELISELESFSLLTSVGFKHLGQSSIHPNGFIAFTPHVLNEIDGLVKYLTFKPGETEPFPNEEANIEKASADDPKTRTLNKPSPYSPSELRLLLQKELAAMKQRLQNVQILAFSDGPPKLRTQPWSRTDMSEQDSSSEADFSKDAFLEDEPSEGFESSRFSHCCERCTPRKTTRDSAREFLAEIQTLDDLDLEEEEAVEGYPTTPVLGDLRPLLPPPTRQSSMDSDDSGCHVGNGLVGSVLNKVNMPKKPDHLAEKSPSITPRLAPLSSLKQSHVGRKVESRLGPKKAEVLLNHKNSGAGDMHEESQNSRRIFIAAERQPPASGHGSSFSSAQRFRRLVMDSRFPDTRTTKVTKVAQVKSVRKPE